jgi:hypothetical protein
MEVECMAMSSEALQAFKDLMREDWSNSAALGYLKYALVNYNTFAEGENKKGFRVLTVYEQEQILEAMERAFENLAVSEAKDYSEKRSGW